MQELKNSFTVINQKILDYRALQRLILTGKFERAFKSSSTKERESILDFISNGKKTAVIKWLKEQTKEKQILEDMSIRELRTIAQQNCISRYTQYRKTELVSILKRLNDE